MRRMKAGLHTRSVAAPLVRPLHILQGIVETHEDRARDRERNRLANDYEELDSRKTDRHWNEKLREEMTERDWRIFREDFSISYKGNTGGTLPLRNWEEAGFPESIIKVCASFDRLSWGVVAHATCRCSSDASQEVDCISGRSKCL